MVRLVVWSVGCVVVGFCMDMVGMSVVVVVVAVEFMNVVYHVVVSHP